MGPFYSKGCILRAQAKEIVYGYMKSTPDCAPSAPGMKCAEIFRECGLGWGAYANATSSNQQYWLVALLRELEKDGKVTRDPITKLWKLL